MYDTVVADLNWFLEHVRIASGILAYQAADWNPLQDYHIQIRCDACPKGMGFWCVDSLEGFYADVPVWFNKPEIFYWEAVCILSALLWAAKQRKIKANQGQRLRVLLLTDNEPTVHIFDSLGALPFYNEILKAAVHVLITESIDLRVLHIPGEQNEIADVLSRKRFDIARQLQPGLVIKPFQPPRLSLGAAEK